MMSSEPQLGQRRKGGMLDISDEDDRHPLFYPPFTKKHYRFASVSVEIGFMVSPQKLKYNRSNIVGANGCSPHVAN
jgi:hypothetical protein